MEKIIFTPEGNGEAVEFYVLEQTRIGGTNYILVTDVEDGDGDALILKDVSSEDDPEAIYEIVENDEELSLIASIFEELIDDMELQE